jgi:hypothetical protein
MAMKKSTFAMPAAVDAIPPKPNTAATSATSRKIKAHFSMSDSGG